MRWRREWRLRLSVMFGGGEHVVVEELRPAVGVFPPDFVAKIVNRYSFVKFPIDLFDALQNGYKFSMGKNPQNGEPILQFDIYRDGLIAIARDTNTAYKVFDGLSEWAIEEFKFQGPVIEPIRTYSSNVIVEFERSPELLFGKFRKLASIISFAYRNEPKGYTGDLRLWRLALMADPGLQLPFPQTQFLLERRAMIPAERERYYSAAPLSTDKHLKVLEEIENMLE
jgi:hypothetical protein